MKAAEFMKYKNWVVVGDVLNKQKYAYRIKNSLKLADYNVSGVKPGLKDEDAYSSLKDIPYEVEVLDLCINPVVGISIVRDAAELGITRILIQPGAESKEILQFCKENNINAIEGCALVELNNMGRKTE